MKGVKYTVVSEEYAGASHVMCEPTTEKNGVSSTQDFRELVFYGRAIAPIFLMFNTISKSTEFERRCKLSPVRNHKERLL